MTISTTVLHQTHPISFCVCLGGRVDVGNEVCQVKTCQTFRSVNVWKRKVRLSTKQMKQLKAWQPDPNGNNLEV